MQQLFAVTKQGLSVPTRTTLGGQLGDQKAEAGDIKRVITLSLTVKETRLRSVEYVYTGMKYTCTGVAQCHVL